MVDPLEKLASYFINTAIKNLDPKVSDTIKHDISATCTEINLDHVFIESETFAGLDFFDNGNGCDCSACPEGRPTDYIFGDVQMQALGNAKLFLNRSCLLQIDDGCYTWRLFVLK